MAVETKEVKESDLDKLAAITVSAEQINAVAEGGGAGLTPEQTATLDKLDGINSSASEIDTSTQKTFNKIVRKINKNPIDRQNENLSGGYNAYANIVKYNNEEFNAIKVYVKVESNTTLRVQLIDPAQFNNANWWERKSILIDTNVYLKADVAVTPLDEYVTVQLPATVNSSKVALPYFYVAISTEEAVNGVQLATHDCELTNTDKGGFLDLYSVIDTQKNTDNGFRFYDSTTNATTFYFELLHLNYDGLRTESIEQSILYPSNIESNIVNYPNFFGAEGIESHLYFKNFQKSLIDNYGYEYNCFPYGLALAEDLRIGRQEDERFIKYNKALVTGNKSEWANINFYPKKFQEPTDNVRFKHIVSASSNGAGQNIYICHVGESTTAQDMYTQRILDIEATDGMNVFNVGTRGTGVNKHEGVGGMTMTWHLNDNLSAFTSAENVFNYPAFITAIGGVIPTIISIQIGINAMLMVKNKYDLQFYINREMASYTTFINNIKASQPSTKFIVNTCILPHERQSAFGKDFDTYLNRDLYREAVQAYNEALIALFKDRESENIYLNCTQTLAIDCKNGFDSEPIALSEHTTLTADRGASGSGVHPASYGYKLMGDAEWAILKYIYRP